MSSWWPGVAGWTVVVAWVLGWLAFGRPRSLPPVEGAAGRRPAPPLPGSPPEVSIVIPARNEATNLPLLLGDLADVLPPGWEVIVVDDESEDDTAAVAEAAGFVTVIRSGGPPDGAAGKPWACHLGAQEAAAELLCFLDADVRLRPGALEALRQAHADGGGLVSVQPRHLTRTAREKLSALFNVVAVMGAGIGGSDSRSSTAFGPVLFTSRADYDTVGGHAGVLDAVVEDLALARAYRRLWRPVNVFIGGDLVGFRMYPDGLVAMMRGWARNMASGAAATNPWRLLATVAWVAGVGATIGPAVSAVLTLPEVTATSFAALVVWAAFVVQLRRMFAVVGNFRWGTAMAYPILFALFVTVFAWSLWFMVARRRVMWRGRPVLVGAPRS